MSLLIRNAEAIICDPAKVVRDCDVLIEGSLITGVGKNLAVQGQPDTIDASGCVVIPGLINAHTHLYQNFLKGVSGNIPLVPWCNQVLFPTVGAIRDGVKGNGGRIPYLWTAISAIEMIRGGITCCINMDVTYRETMQAWQEIGFRGVMAFTLSNKWVPAELRGSDDEMRRKVLDFAAEYHLPDGLTSVFIAPSTLFLCDDPLLRWAGEQARAYDLGVQIHISETFNEVQESIEETGKRPVERLRDLDLLDARLSAVHCVHLDESEIEMLSKAGTTVVHCPKSNMKLADGAAPIKKLKLAGASLALGNDGCGSNDLLDMWEEMRAAAMLARVTEMDAAALSPADVLAMATVTAAKAARVNAGSVETGKLADLAIIDLSAAHLRPFHDDEMINMLVFCGKASDIRDTIINGRVVMRDRRITTVDEIAIFEEAERNEAPLYRKRADYPY